MIEPGQAPPAGEELRSTTNVQIIDGATNCTYSIYAFTDEQFALLFPEEGQRQGAPSGDGRDLVRIEGSALSVFRSIRLFRGSAVRVSG